ncbi:MAG TPA: tRNA (N6-isopentenyl adenosine(37)-C2)-methylthiotransferase MiaB [bacterium]|nr:tRNA (N6-isopentenyl adenosine(37)-C2)-methylthiotransferase MiaB [bacterium]
MEPSLTEPPPKKVFLETFGCQSNVLESDHVASLLRQKRFLMTEDAGEADVILFNTCSIRQHAEDKVFSRLGELGDWKRGRDGRVVGVLGCMATSYKEKLLERAPHLDLVVGPDQYLKVPEVLEKASRDGLSQVLADFDPVYFPQNDPARLAQPHKAFLEIMKGCDKFCTFCVVPFTRGREVSRPAEDILEEAARLAAAGVKEVTLLGQNVNSYGLGLKSKGKTITFAELLTKVGQVPGLQRVRFMTSHPLDLSDELIEAMAESPSACEYFHLPVQCGSDPILKRMSRKYSVAHYLERAAKLKARVKDIALTTDLIVGFPGESEEDFKGTLRLLEQVHYDLVFSFKYSPRAGTPAARMLDQVPEEVKDERLARLNELAWRQAAAKHAARVGLVEEVLVDGPADKTPDASYGKTRQNKTVVITNGVFKAGDLVKVKIEGSKIAALYGTAV